MKRLSILVLAILLLALLPGTAWSGDKVPPLKQALGAAFLAKAELALLKGQLNSGKVYLAAAHEADPSISVFRLKAFDMMYKDFPYLNNMIPGYRGGPAAFSMDGRFVAYSTRDSVSRLDLETGELKSVGRPRMQALRIEISPKGRFVATCDNRGHLALCDMKRETQVGQFSFRKEEPRSLTSIRISFSLDENSIVAYYRYSDEKAIYFLSTMDLSVIRTVAGISMGIGPIRFLADGSLLASPRARTALVDPATMKTTKTLAPRTGWDVDYLPSKNLLAVGGSGSIEVFDSTTQERVAEYQAASHNIVLVRFLGDGQYIAYASPKGESGIIDCTSGKPIQLFNIGRDAAVSPSRYLLLAQGKAIDLSACRPSQTNFNAEMPHATRPDGSAIPAAVLDAMSSTSGEAMSRSGRSVTLTLRSASGDLTAYGTRDGRTFIYDHGKVQVNLLITDHYRGPIDFAFFPDDSHFVRLCVTGTGMAGAVEVYSLPGGSRSTLRLEDPPVSIAIAPDLGVTAILDRKNRVFLSVLPSLDTTVELLPATQTKRQIFVDRKTKTLVVKTDSSIVSYDLRKVAEDRAFPTYVEAVKLYGVSLEELEPQFDRPARVERRKVSPVAPTTTRFDVPEENLKIPQEMQTCTENLQKISTAIKKYKKDKGKLPDWLSDLVPDYLSSETLLCSSDAKHKSPYSPDPRLPCSYGWQFSAKPIPPGWDPTGRTLYRDWKIQQVKLFGDVVPMVRCYHHTSKRVLNLSAGGEIWWGPLDWEYMFRPDYASIHKQMLSRAIASRPADPSPSRSAPKQSSPLVGKLAPSFTLKDLEGKQVSLSDFKGKVVLLDFWATWCGPCIRAIPHLEALHRKYKEQGLVVIGINHERDHDKVKAFSKEQISYVVLLDADEQFKEYGIRGIPTAFYINREGEIRHCEIGFGPGKENEMEQKIKELLAGKEDIAAAPKSLILQEVSGTKFLRGTWGWDIDSDSDGPKKSRDIWWEHVNERERYLVPRNGAGLAIVRDKAFDDLHFSDLDKMEFSRERISASDVKPDIDVGTVLAVRTTEGNLVKLEVIGFDPLRNRISKYHMRLRYTLYKKFRQRIEDQKHREDSVVSSKSEQENFDFIKALEINPKDAHTYIHRGIVYSRKGEYDQAILDFSKAIEINPKNAVAYCNRGLANSKKGEYDRAISGYNKALEINPKHACACNNLAWLFATCPDGKYRDGRKAVDNAIRACELSQWTRSSYLDTLAAAYAEVGDFDQAVKWQSKAIELATPDYDMAAAPSSLKLYKAGKPYREEQ